jgi:hypothetical protein
MLIGRHIFKHISIALFGAAVSWTALNPARAQAQKEEHKLTLRAIMQELGAEHLRLTNALLIDDLKSVEESAKAIQGHPLPDEIVAAIKSTLGREFQAFEASTSEATKRLPVSPSARKQKTSRDRR